MHKKQNWPGSQLHVVHVYYEYLRPSSTAALCHPNLLNQLHRIFESTFNLGFTISEVQISPLATLLSLLVKSKYVWLTQCGQETWHKVSRHTHTRLAHCLTKNTELRTKEWNLIAHWNSLLVNEKSQTLFLRQCLCIVCQCATVYIRAGCVLISAEWIPSYELVMKSHLRPPCSFSSLLFLPSICPFQHAVLTNHPGFLGHSPLKHTQHLKTLKCA